MKFGKLLQDFSRADLEKDACSEPGGPSRKRQKLEDAEIRADREFLKYKQMKKLLKKAAELKEEGDDVGMRGVEKEFIRVLYDDVDRINSYFMEVEEDCVIKLQCLRDSYEEECPKKKKQGMSEEEWLSRPEMRKIRSQFIDLHGELVLLLHWSIVNYAGILKILKKHDKLLGGHAQKDLVGSILRQPFVSTGGITKLAQSAEVYVKKLGAVHQEQEEEESEDSMRRNDSISLLMNEAIAWAEESGGNAILIEKTKAALDMLKQLQSTAHSPSTFVGPDKCMAT
jgi:SPX domain protein involved in polyphosphate accumulation